jgi:hypothetical protein
MAKRKLDSSIKEGVEKRLVAGEHLKDIAISLRVSQSTLVSTRKSWGSIPLRVRIYDAPCMIVGCGKKVHGLGYCNLHYKRFKIYGDPLFRKIRNSGEGTPHIDGYWIQKINGESELRHRVIAEKALGKKLPPGAEVHHVDEDKSNDSNNNLVICQNRSYHKLLHKRARETQNGLSN